MRTEEEVRRVLKDLDDATPILKQLNMGFACALHAATVDLFHWMLCEKSAFEAAAAQMAAVDKLFDGLELPEGGTHRAPPQTS